MKAHATKQPHAFQGMPPASVTRALAEPGRPLQSPLRADMEQRFHHDFSRVRIHSGDAADQSTRDVNARAFTTGSDIVFGAGEQTEELIAHELTHVVEQSAGGESLQLAPRVTPPPATPTPPSWLGASAANAVHVQGDVWNVKIATLGGDTWVGPYDQLQAYINKQGYGGQLEAAHIVGGEHLEDIGSPFSYGKAPCVAVDKSLHATWTTQTSELQSRVGPMGGRATAAEGRPIVAGRDVIDLYDELYRGHPELQEMARKIVKTPGKAAVKPVRVPKPPSAPATPAPPKATKPSVRTTDPEPVPLSKGAVVETTPPAPRPPAAAPAPTGRIVQKFGSVTVDYDPTVPRPQAVIKLERINLADYPPDREGAVTRFLKRGSLQTITTGVSLTLLVSSLAADVADEDTKQTIQKFTEPIQSHFRSELRDARRDFEDNFPNPDGLFRGANIEDFAKAYADATAKLRLPQNARVFAAVMMVFTPPEQQEEAARMLGPALANRGANPEVRARFRDAALAYETAMADLQQQLMQYPPRLAGIADDVARRAEILKLAADELEDTFWRIMYSPAAAFPPVYYETLGIYRVSMVFRGFADSMGGFAREIRSREMAYAAMIDRLDARLIEVGDRINQMGGP